MDVLYERVAGIDVGKKTLTCCVRTPGKDGARHGETRTYRVDRGVDRALHRAPRVAGWADAGPAESGGAGAGRVGRADRCCDGAVGPSVGAAANHPRVGLKTAQVIIAETGADMSRFPSAAHLAARARVAPAIAGVRRETQPSRVTQGNRWLASMLVEAANSVSRTKDTYLAARFARIAACRGKSGPRSPSRTRSWSAPITCSNGTSPTVTWDGIGLRPGIATRTPAGWWPNCNASTTLSSSIPRPNSLPGSSRQNRGNVRAPPGRCRLPTSGVFHGSAPVCRRSFRG
jgi:hypothetical protein